MGAYSRVGTYSWGCSYHSFDFVSNSQVKNIEMLVGVRDVFFFNIFLILMYCLKSVREEDNMKCKTHLYSIYAKYLVDLIQTKLKNL